LFLDGSKPVTPPQEPGLIIDYKAVAAGIMRRGEAVARVFINTALAEQ